MTTPQLDRLPLVAIIATLLLIVAACTIRLRGDEGQSQPTASVAREADPMAARLERCRDVTYDQKAALQDCRRIWAERRRQFLGQGSEPSVDERDGAPSTSATPKDKSRLPADSLSTPNLVRD